MTMSVFKGGVLVEAGNMEYPSFQNRDPGEEEERVYFTISVSQGLYSQQALCEIEIERRVEAVVVVV